MRIKKSIVALIQMYGVAGAALAVFIILLGILSLYLNISWICFNFKM
jgi:hypothetical protein